MTKIKCAACNKVDATYHATYGYMPCAECQKVTSVHDPYEFVPNRIKEDRKMFRRDVIQPFRDGVLSREYVEQYGTSRISVTPEEVKQARNVWSDDPNQYYKP